MQKPEVNWSSLLGTPYVSLPEGYVCGPEGTFLKRDDVINAKREHLLSHLYTVRKAEGDVRDWSKAQNGICIRPGHPDYTDAGQIPAAAEPVQTVQDITVSPGLPEKQLPSPDTAPSAAGKTPAAPDDIPPGKLDDPEDIKIVPAGYTQNTVKTAEVPLKAVRDYILAGMLAVVASGAFILSMELSQRVQTVNIGPRWGILLAGIMTGFSTVALTVSIEFHKKHRRGMAFIFMLLFLTVILYSMTNTMNVFYSSYMQHVRSTQTGRADVVRAQDDLTGIDTMLTTVSGQMKTVTSNINYYQAHGWGTQKFTDSLEVLSKKQAGLLDKRSKIIEQTPGAAIEKTSDNESFQERIGRIFHKDGSWVQLMLSCFPALFLDLIAPISLAGAAEIAGKGKKKKEAE